MMNIHVMLNLMIPAGVLLKLTLAERIVQLSFLSGGVAEVRPFGAMKKNIVERVY